MRIKRVVSAVRGWLRNREPEPAGLVSLSPEGDVSAPVKVCQCCGKGGLSWGRYAGKWRLFDGRTIHICPVNPLILDDGRSLASGEEFGKQFYE